MEERNSAAVDAAQTVEAYWVLLDVVNRMPESELREKLINVLEPELGNVMRRAV